MNKMLISALALFMLAGCSVSKPGGFERVDEDARSNTVQYRYDPQKLDKDALELIGILGVWRGMEKGG